MIVQFDDILIKNNILIHGGKIELEKNRIYAVLGANGVGKTLLLKRLFQERAIFVKCTNGKQGKCGHTCHF